jgi:hypothetical protein
VQISGAAGSRVLTMPDLSDAVTVIVPTLARTQRAALLKRAVASVLEQQGVDALPLIVVNGAEYDRSLVATLKEDARVNVIDVAQADLPGALRTGRSYVTTPWFTALDDDDVLLPGALSVRLRALKARSDCAAVVTNGLRRDAGGDTLHMSSFDAIRHDPLRALVKLNWLLPGAWLGRTSAFEDEVFATMPRYLECTYLAVRLATTHRTCFLDEPTIAWSTDTPQSASKSREYAIGAEAALERILALDLPPDVRQAFRGKLADAQHSVVRLYMAEGAWRAAWEQHLRSLRGPRFWRFLTLTPRLFLMPRSGVSSS